MSHSFWESGTWEQLSWWVLAPRVSWGCTKVLASTFVFWRCDWARGSAARFTHMAADWRVLGPYHMGLSIWLLTRWQLAFPKSHDQRERKRGQKWKPQCFFYNLISELTYHHFCCIWFVTQTHPGTIWEGPMQRYVYRRGESSGAILEVCHHSLPSKYWPTHFPRLAVKKQDQKYLEVSQHHGKKRLVKFRGGW